jgi:hypothetical protein
VGGLDATLAAMTLPAAAAGTITPPPQEHSSHRHRRHRGHAHRSALGRSRLLRALRDGGVVVVDGYREWSVFAKAGGFAIDEGVRPKQGNEKWQILDLNRCLLVHIDLSQLLWRRLPCSPKRYFAQPPQERGHSDDWAKISVLFSSH